MNCEKFRELEVLYGGEFPHLLYLGDLQEFTRNDMIDGRNSLWELFKISKNPRFAPVVAFDAQCAAFLQRFQGDDFARLTQKDRLWDAAPADVSALRKERSALADSIKALLVSTYVARVNAYHEGLVELNKLVTSWTRLVPIVPEGTGQKASLIKCLTELRDRVQTIEENTEDYVGDRT